MAGIEESVPQAREIIEMYMRMQNMSLEDAATKASGIFSSSLIDDAVGSIRQQAMRQQLLKVPAGVTKLEYERLLDDVRGNQWYTGPNEAFDKHWPPLKVAMSKSMGEAVADSVDQASTKIVSLLGDPGVHGLSKKGLVVGYVQSGKTANYSAVCAKAADAGFRLFIVLSGIHNSLRSQTQVRLDTDLVESYRDPWCRLTNATEDFGSVHQGDGLLSARELRNLIVIKKNSARLQRLVDWLKSIHENVRLSCPTIIIDDEADQATPNSQAAKNEISKINELTRQIFKLLPSATYIGYTATPFANVLIDPQAEEDLYPGDFIIDLPRPSAYFGSEQLFGREPLSEDEVEKDGFDMIRIIADSDELVASGSKKDQEGFVPSLPTSLRDAVLWFLLSVAARWERGQRKHTSMLVHTSHLVHQHSVVADLVSKCLDKIRADGVTGTELNELWDAETKRVSAETFGRDRVRFDQIAPFIDEVLAACKVLIDNGSSIDRLEYDTDEPQTVIAVGGQTLSRGLTLEGLTVSYFLRNSKTYDTLLQMGRWFGYRIGYEELPRVWMEAGMIKNFRDLATIEQEIRVDMKRYCDEGITPKQMGLRIRQHPTMAVTAASKMHFAEKVQLSFAGSRKQTFRFDCRDLEIQKQNMDVTRDFIAGVAEGGIDFRKKKSRWIAKDVPCESIYEYLERFSIADVHVDLQPELTVGYLKTRKDEAADTWNVAVMGSGVSRLKNYKGVEFEPGDIDLGLPELIKMVNRAPLKGSSIDGYEDIKALMSQPDRFVDLDIPSEEIKESGMSNESLRRKYSEGKGLLLIYPISGKSQPTTKGTRVPFSNSVNMIGLGIVFPDFIDRNDTVLEEHNYIGLPASIMPTALEAPDEDELEVAMLAGDDDGTADYDGTEALSEIGQ